MWGSVVCGGQWYVVVIVMWGQWYAGVYILAFAGPKRIGKKMTTEQNLGRIFFIQPDLPKKEKSFLTFFRILFMCQEHLSQLSLKIISEFNLGRILFYLTQSS